MGLFDFLKPRAKRRGLHSARTMGWGNSYFVPFGEDIYASDIIVQAIRCKANEFKKLEPRHISVDENGAKISITDSTIAKVLRRPNEYMTTADFLEKITILLELNKNVYIYPEYYVTNGGQKYYTALYPLKPISTEYLSDDNGAMFIQLSFKDGYDVTLPVNEIIHWRKDYGVNDYFGGDMFGGDDNRGLLKILKRYDEITQGIARALDVSCQINGIVKYKSYHSDEVLDQKRNEFERRLRNGESAILCEDQSTEYTPITHDVKIADSETLKFFYDTILMNTGVSQAILRGDYTKAQKEAFYEHALEGDIKSLGQAMSKCMITDRATAFGNDIVLYPNNINFMSMENKISALQASLPAGIFTKDEAREILGYPPLPNGQGQVIAQGYNNLLDENNKNKLTE